MKKGTSKLSAAGQMTGQMTPELLTQLRAAAELPEEEINIGDPDAPEATNWVGAVRGRFYKPRKVQRTLRIDADVLAYFEAQGPGHLTRMNRVLRASMLRGLRRQRQRKKQHA